MNNITYYIGYNTFLNDVGLIKTAKFSDLIKKIQRKGLLRKTPIPPKAQKPLNISKGNIPKPADQMGPAEQSARVFEEAFQRNKGELYPTTLKGRILTGAGLGLAGLGAGAALKNKTNELKSQSEGLLNHQPTLISSSSNPYYTYNNSFNRYYGP